MANSTAVILGEKKYKLQILAQEYTTTNGENFANNNKNATKLQSE